MGKLQALLEKQKELDKQIEQAREEEKAKHKSDFVTLYSKLKLERFTTQQILEALNLLAGNQDQPAQKVKKVSTAKAEEVQG